MRKYDAIIIGGGHNGLILGNYLVRAGMTTLILERRLEIGGGLTTEECTIPGFLHNLHSYFHDAINVMPAYLDLDLAEFNARYYCPPVQAGSPLKNGQAITLHMNVDKTCESIARISKHDAKAYRWMYENYGEFIESAVIPALFTRPQPPSHQLAVLENSPEGLDFVRLGRLSPKDVLDEYFENEHVKALILAQLPIPRGIVPDYDGLGAVIPLMISGAEHSQICLGGSHVLAHALWRSFLAHGGMPLGLSHVSKILVENGEAIGVEVQSGEQYFANKVVASAIDVQQTFMELVDEECLSEDFLQKIRNFKRDEFSVFSVHMALNEPPAYTSGIFDPDINQAFKLNIGLETGEEYRRLWSDIRDGRLPEPAGMFCSVPTLFDPGQAPEGKHTAFIWQCVPYHLKDGGAELWDEIKNDYMERCVDTWRRYAPNLNDRNIIRKMALSPLDIDRKLCNMKDGGLFMGRLIQGQLEYFRPLPELSHCRTPIKNLYLGGACCHPGGGIIGAAGMIAAEVIAEDYGLEKWWES